MTAVFLDCEPFAVHIIERTGTVLKIAVVSRTFPGPQLTFKEFNFATKLMYESRYPTLQLKAEPLDTLLYKNQLLILFSDSILYVKLASFQQVEKTLPFFAYRLHAGFVTSQLGDIYAFDDQLTLVKLGKGVPAFALLRVGYRLLLVGRLRFYVFDVKEFSGEEALLLVYEQAIDAQFATYLSDSLIFTQGCKVFQVQQDGEIRSQFDASETLTCGHHNCIAGVRGSVFYGFYPVMKLHGCCICCADGDGCCVAGTDLHELAIWWQ